MGRLTEQDKRRNSAGCWRWLYFACCVRRRSQKQDWSVLGTVLCWRMESALYYSWLAFESLCCGPARVQGQWGLLRGGGTECSQPTVDRSRPAEKWDTHVPWLAGESRYRITSALQLWPSSRRPPTCRCFPRVTSILRTLGKKAENRLNRLVSECTLCCSVPNASW